MATITVKTYRCDACGDKVESQKDLRRFDIEWGRSRRPRYGYASERPGIRVELCGGCVEQFASSLKPFIDQAGVDAILPPSENGDEPAE